MRNWVMSARNSSLWSELRQANPRSSNNFPWSLHRKDKAMPYCQSNRESRIWARRVVWEWSWQWCLMGSTSPSGLLKRMSLHKWIERILMHPRTRYHSSIWSLRSKNQSWNIRRRMKLRQWRHVKECCLISRSASCELWVVSSHTASFWKLAALSSMSREC